MEETQTLKQLGLSEKQAKIYLSLLRLGESPMTAIARKANLKRPTVYLIIDELIILGLCSEITKGKKKFYSATHPRRLIEMTRFRNEQAEKLVPKLIALRNTAEKPTVQMFEGIEGIRTAYEEAFVLLSEEKNEGLWIGNISVLIEKFPEVLREYSALLRKLKRYKVRELIFGGEQSRLWVEEMQNRVKPNHKLKYISSEGGMTDQLIIGNKVFFFSMNKNLFTTVIEGEEITKTQKLLFETIWSKF
ncbi:MAG TPA: helix-turn-helix domain-containing protein [Candidatus Paceibacterota bacterium]